MINVLHSNSTTPARTSGFPTDIYRYFEDEVPSSSSTQYYSCKTSSGTETIPKGLVEYPLHSGSADDTRTRKNKAMIELLRSWREEDEQEQRTTWELLREALEEDRWSDRELFPCPE